MSGPPAMPEPPRAWRRLILGAAALAGIILVLTVGAFALAITRGTAPTPQQWLLALTLAGSSHLVLRSLLLFDWRGQRVALAPDEMLVFVALLTLPVPLVILFAVPAMTIYQYTTRRGWLRGSANVAVLAIATASAAAAFTGLQALHAHPALAAALAISVYTVVNLTMVSAFFALRESTSAFIVYRERFLVPTVFHVAVGVSAGLAVVALWSYHPLAVLVLAPFAFFLREHVRLMARIDRESTVHKRIAEVTHALVGEPNVDRVAERVIETCGDIFHAGRVTLTLATTRDRPARTWARDLEGGHDPHVAPLAVALAGAGPNAEPIGAIMVYPTRATQERYQAADQELLRIVAGEAAVSIQSAKVLGDLDASRQQLITNRVARPFVKRIVRALIDETRADRTVLVRLGRSVARDTDAPDIETLCAAYGEMGLGSLRLEDAQGDRFTFSGQDLFERQPGAHSTTCDLALGFLMGAVSQLHAAEAKGTELQCQSRGDARCVFVLQTRPL
ncbi:MAG: 4-vinyl reductase [Candidatus Thermoplasmatota archaeon]